MENTELSEIFHIWWLILPLELCVRGPEHPCCRGAFRRSDILSRGNPVLAGLMALEMHSSQSSPIPSLIQRKLRFLIPSQRFLLFGLKFSPGDQHCDFVISCVMCGGGRKQRQPEKEPCWNRSSREVGGCLARWQHGRARRGPLGLCIVL